MDVVHIAKPLINLPDEQKQLRDEFVKHYIVDYDGINAVMCMGYPRDVARTILEQFMNCPYVAQQMRKLESELDGDEDIEKRRLFSSLRREASYQGHGSSHAARVAALAKLASLRGMDKPMKVEHDITNRGGVMVVPGTASLDDWEKAATSTQEALQKGSALT